MLRFKMDKWKFKERQTQNEYIHLKIEVAPIKKKMRENFLRWYGHVQRRATNALARNNISFKSRERKEVEKYLK